MRQNIATEWMGNTVLLPKRHLELWIRLRVREKLSGPRVVGHRSLREEMCFPTAGRVGPLYLLEFSRMLRVGLKSHGANTGQIIAEGGIKGGRDDH